MRPIFHPTPASLATRYTVDAATSCWVWLGPFKQHSGYGMCSTGSRKDGSHRYWRAHRLVYSVLVGPIPDGLTLDHLCRNESCVNPEHLEPVTMRENLIRGTGFVAGNVRKTHCPQGHPYDVLRRDGARGCRRCQTAYSRAWQKRNRDRYLAQRRARRRAASA